MRSFRQAAIWARVLSRSVLDKTLLIALKWRRPEREMQSPTMLLRPRTRHMFLGEPQGCDMEVLSLSRLLPCPLRLPANCLLLLTGPFADSILTSGPAVPKADAWRVEIMSKPPHRPVPGRLVLPPEDPSKASAEIGGTRQSLAPGRRGSALRIPSASGQVQVPRSSTEAQETFAGSWSGRSIAGAVAIEPNPPLLLRRRGIGCRRQQPREPI
jgi:hypothetical protein